MAPSEFPTRRSEERSQTTARSSLTAETVETAAADVGVDDPDAVLTPAAVTPKGGATLYEFARVKAGRSPWVARVTVKVDRRQGADTFCVVHQLREGGERTQYAGDNLRAALDAAEAVRRRIQASTDTDQQGLGDFSG